MLAQDLRYAIRSLSRSPGLVVTIILTFALGVGANAAMFTVIDRLYFQAPPGVENPGSVRRLLRHGRSFDGSQYAGANFTVREHATLAAVGLGDVEGYTSETRPLGESQRQGVVAYATTGFFKLAGVRAYRGRFFTPDENVYGAPIPLAILSHSYWTREFGADAAVIGTQIRIDTSSFSIIGVAPPGFDGMDLDAVDVWVPLATRPWSEARWWQADMGFLDLFLRMTPGVDERAMSSRLTAALRQASPSAFRFDDNLRIEASPLLEARTPLRFAGEDARNMGLVVRLAGLALLVLLIAMSNVASLLLMRAIRRRREIAIRVALGVSRRQLMTQAITESVLLALIGGVAAVVMAGWIGTPLRTTVLSNIHWTTTVIDARLVLFTAGTAIVAGIAAGMIPAFAGFRSDILSALKAGSSDSGRARSGVRVSLLVTQAALCMLMLSAAGMFVQSLRKFGDFDRGFDADRLISVSTSGLRPALIEPVIRRISALPSVEAIGASNEGLSGAGGMVPVRFSNGDTVSAARTPMWSTIDTGYARATGMRLLAGRMFNAGDQKGGEPVFLINQAMAEEFWPGRSPVGDCISSFMTKNSCGRIVGVVSNARWWPTRPAYKILYTPATQSPYPCCYNLQVRTTGRPTTATVEAIRQAFGSVSGINVARQVTIGFVTERLEPQVRPFRVAAMMFLLFGFVALAAASAGIYGLVAYDVTQRTREFGVRIALEGTTQSVLRLVVGSGVRVVAFGLIIGVALALGAGRVMSSLLFETSPYDPRVLTATGIVLAVVSLVASLVPAWKATRVDPVIALRAE